MLATAMILDFLIVIITIDYLMSQKRIFNNSDSDIILCDIDPVVNCDSSLSIPG
jgi:hypothetical protein